MKVFVINLEKDVQRRESIKIQLENQKIEFSFHKAVYGRHLTPEELAINYDNKKAIRTQCRRLVPAHIGCSLSHVRLYKKLIEEKVPYACILEDDVILPENFGSIMNKLENKLDLSIPQVILLSPANFKERNIINIDESYQLKQYKNGYLASTYIINQLGAKVLYKELFPVGDVADCWPRLTKHRFVDIKVLTPTLVEQDQFTFGSSTNDDTLSTYKYNKIQKIKFKFCRAFWLSYDGILAIYNRNFKPYAGILKSTHE